MALQPQTLQTSRGGPVSAWISAYPGRAFGAVLALHAVVWTTLPTLLYPNLPLDLIEALMYGREWQLGYDKLPPLPWWLVEIVNLTIGHDFAYYLLAQIAVVTALAIVWGTARPLIGAAGALVAVLIVDGLHYLNYTAAKFNHDVIQLPFWALAGFALHRALRGRQNFDWLLLGLAVGISLWAKYFMVVLAAPMAVFLIVDDDARKAWAGPGPFIAMAAALITMAPHLIWLVHNDFLPLAYAEHRALPSRGLMDHVWHPLQFAVSQLFFLIPSLLIALPLFYPRTREVPTTASDAFDYRIVTWLAFGPIATVLLLSALSGRGTVAMWGYPLWLFLGLWIVLNAHRALDATRLARISMVWAIMFAGFALGFIVNYSVLPNYDHRYRAVFFPGGDLGREITQRYRAATGKAPVYVIGTMWDGGNVAHYASSHPRVLLDGRPERAPWIDLADLRSKGAVVVWTDSDPNAIPVLLRMIAADAAVQPSFELHDRRGNGKRIVGWAILQPKPTFATAPIAGR